MKTRYNFFEVREVETTDEFANLNNLGFIAPIKTCFRNDWKFCFVYDWTRIPSVDIHEACRLADAYKANDCIHLYLTEVSK